VQRRLAVGFYVVLFAAVPLKMLASRFGAGPLDLVDFRNLWRAAHDVLAGRTLYHPAPAGVPLTADCLGPGRDCFVYPPLTAVLAVPFTLLPYSIAAFLYYVLDCAAFVAALRVAGVRDWRCYGVALASGGVLASVQSGTITPFLALGLALGWRYRERRAVAALAFAAVVVAKLFLWPVAVWLMATRRVSTAVATVGAAVALCLASWLPIGFAGLGVYPQLLHVLTGRWQSHAYSPVAFGLAIGLPARAAAALGLAVGGVVLALAVRTARRPGGDQASFALTVAAALLLSPLVWLNYFALPLVPLAIARPTLTRAWALTLPFLFLPGMANGHVRLILVALGLLAAITWVAARPAPSDLPEPVADERYALPRLANADGL
jgi:Glycosyltransferase family 87